MSFIETFTYEAKQKGPHILFLARLHGNEKAGEFALKRLIARLESKEIELLKGRLTIMPCCNPRAAENNVRYIDANLNRIMSDKHIEQYKDTYEASLAPEIMAAVDAADIVIDLHTFTEHMPPVVICIDDQNPISRKLAENCGIERIECDSPFISSPHTQMLLHYARHNNKPSILIESGSHESQDAVETAWHAVLNILITNDMVSGHPSDPVKHEFLVVTSALYNRDNEKLVFPLMDKDRVEHGDPLFELADGTIIRADIGGLLFMRNINTALGEEYAYLCDVLDGWP